MCVCLWKDVVKILLCFFFDQTQKENSFHPMMILLHDSQVWFSKGSNEQRVGNDDDDDVCMLLLKMEKEIN
jgi:hypothetical protein